MTEDSKEAVLKAFRHIPGVGKSIANALWNQGFRGQRKLYKPHDKCHIEHMITSTTANTSSQVYFKCELRTCHHQRIAS